MNVGSAIGTGCLTFLVTNIDNAFVLVTFFAESSTSKNLTPLKITLGQYIGFSVVVSVSLIGYGAAMALPPEPIGFLGLGPLLLGAWRGFGLLFPRRRSSEDGEEDEEESKRIAKAKSILKVAGITMMNGGDNVGTYTPLFSQAKGVEIAVYIIVYYILLGVWCLIAFLILKEKHVLKIAQRYASYIIPFLYVGLGIFIVVKSDCYPWSIEHIDNRFLGDPGRVIMGVVTAVFLSSIMGIMVWARMHKQQRSLMTDDISLPEEAGDDATKVDANPELDGSTGHTAEDIDKSSAIRTEPSMTHSPPEGKTQSEATSGDGIQAVS